MSAALAGRTPISTCVSIRRKGPYGSERVTFNVVSSIASLEAYGPRSSRERIDPVSGSTTRSKLYLAASAFHGEPSWKVTPGCSEKVYVTLSSANSQESKRLGKM